jgi:hypothetical protein
MQPFMTRTSELLTTACAVLALAGAGAAQEQHADYVVLGKSINHRQSADGGLHLLNSVFFAEIFATPDGEVTNGYLQGPGDAAAALRFPEGQIQFLAGAREASIESLTEHYPHGTYRFSFDAPDRDVHELPASFTRARGEMRNPGPIEVSLLQGGVAADPRSIDPDRDLVVRWSPFEKGAADPREIIDDMIYVMMGDCMGTEVVHSGHAISDAHALTYAATEFVIPGEALFPGQPFQLEIEHSNMDTDVWNDIEIIVTYAATSFLDVRTTGADTQHRNCPQVPYAMDGGQTDRERKPEIGTQGQ